MTEAVISWAEVFDAIEDELAAVLNTAGEPAFTVLRGEPTGLPLGGPYAHFWYLGRTDPMHADARKTLTNVMYAARVQVMCFWPPHPEGETWGAWDVDIATIDTSIRRRLRANSTLNSNVTDLEITDSEVSYGTVPMPSGGNRGLYRVLAMELVLDNLEGEAIAP